LYKCICLSRSVVRCAVIRFIDFVFDLVSMDGQFIYALGTQESAQWSEGDSSDVPPSVSYYHGEKHVIVDLVCSTNGTNRFEALGEDPINVYRFRLTDKCACWNRCEGK